MKKLLFLASLLTLVLSVPTYVGAEESLLDNELDLKTDRLNQEQTDKNSTQSVTIDENLFNTEQMEKLKQGEAKQEQQRKKEIDQLFNGKTLTAKEVDVDNLFLTTENQEAAGQTETAAVSTEPARAPLLLPLLLIAAAISVFVMLFYYVKKRGQENGRKQRAH